MFELHLAEDATITLEEGEQFKPHLVLNNLRVILSVSNLYKELNEEELTVIGSTQDWLCINPADTIGFDPDTRLLKLIMLRYPESNKVPGNLNVIRAAEKIVGLPKLVSCPVGFQVMRLPYRYYNMEENVLLCFNDECSLAEKLTEVFVSKDLSFFFNNNLYCGWGLYNPEIFMAMDLGPKKDYPSDSFHKQSFKEVFDLMADETLDLIVEEQNESYLQQIAILHNRLVAYGIALGCCPLSALSDWLFDVADRFYKKEQMHGLFVRSFE
jgi:hypothetical protein